MTIPFGPHITNKMPSGLITLDREGRITGHNPASERIFDETFMTSDLLPDLVRESQALKDLLSRCVKAGEVFTRVEFNVPTRSGIDKRIGINLSPITNPQGQVEGAICLLSDLTEIVELQNQIKLKENFAALGEMSASIAHEFKNSVATIVGYAQMSKTEADVDTLHLYAAEIHKESRSLSNMVTDFLNFAKPVLPTMYEIDLVELLDSVIADLKSRRPGGYDIRFQSSGEAVVVCDSTLMRQSFINLLINATDALEGKGTISVSVEVPEGRNSVRVMIQDTGHGIPKNLIPKIFFPFFTTKAHGTGLGLSLVQKIILAHNGRIEVQSTEGQGTCFTVTLPRK